MRKNSNNFIVINKLTFKGRMKLSLEMPPPAKGEAVPTVWVLGHLCLSRRRFGWK